MARHYKSRHRPSIGRVRLKEGLEKISKLRGVLKFSLATLIITTAIGIYDFIIPLFTEEFAGTKYTLIGLTISLAYIGAFMVEAPFGVIASKVGRKKLLLISLAIIAVLGVLFYITTSVFILMALAFLFGIISIGYWLPAGVIVREETPRKMEAQTQSIYLFFYDLGWTVGPILAGLIVSLFSERMNFLLFAGIVAVGLVANFLVIKRDRTIRVERKKEKGGAKLSEFFSSFKQFPKIHEHATTAYLLSMFLWIYIGIQWIFIVLTATNNFGLPEEFAGIILGAMMGVTTLLYYSSGYLMDRVGVKYITAMGFILLFACTYFIFLSNNIYAFFFLIILSGGAVAWITPGTEGLATVIIPENTREKMVGVYDSSKDLGLIIGGIGGGIIADLTGSLMSIYLFAAIVAAIGSIVTVRLWGKGAFKLTSNKK